MEEMKKNWQRLFSDTCSKAKEVVGGAAAKAFQHIDANQFAFTCVKLGDRNYCSFPSFTVNKSGRTGIKGFQWHLIDSSEDIDQLERGLAFFASTAMPSPLGTTTKAKKKLVAFQDEEDEIETNKDVSEPAQKCRQYFGKKYTSRLMPPYNAAQCEGLVKKGNDGKFYISKQNKSGDWRWSKHKSADDSDADDSEEAPPRKRPSSSAQECVDQSRLARYKERPGPPYSAKACAGQRKKGNDGLWYITKADKNGVIKWVKVKANAEPVSTPVDVSVPRVIPPVSAAVAKKKLNNNELARLWQEQMARLSGLEA